MEPEPKKEKKRQIISTPKPKKEKEGVVKPSFNAPSESDLKKVVASAVINNGSNIGSSSGICHELATNEKGTRPK